jgi:hypothetical protein
MAVGAPAVGAPLGLAEMSLEFRCVGHRIAGTVGKDQTMATPRAIAVVRDPLCERNDLAEQFRENNQGESGSRLAKSAISDGQMRWVSEVGHRRVTSEHL